MNREISVLPIRFYIFLSVLLHLLFLIIALMLMVSLTGLNQGIPVVLFVSVMFIISSPVVGIIGWLIDKGSNGENRSGTFKAIGGVAGITHGAFAGAMIARALFGTAVWVGIVGFIVFFLLGRAVGARLGVILGKRIAGLMGFRT